MAITIPTQIEQDFHTGKAEYKTFQTGFGPQSILPCDPNSYNILYGYTLYPAGGGWTHFDTVGGVNQLTSTAIAQFGLQQLLFFTQGNFYPFIHNINIQQSPVITDFDPATGQTTLTSLAYDVDTTPIDNNVFIKTSRNISIAHGLIQSATQIFTGFIPQTGDLPDGLSYGNYGIPVTVQTNLATGLGTPSEFLQPDFNLWDQAPYSYGLYGAGAQNQLWAKADSIAGMYPAQSALIGLGGPSYVNNASSNYILVCHYAQYPKNEN